MTSKIKKSIIEEDPSRKSPHAHVIQMHVNKVTGQINQKKGKGHGKEEITVETWIARCQQVLLAYPVKRQIRRP